MEKASPGRKGRVMLGSGASLSAPSVECSRWISARIRFLLLSLKRPFNLLT